MNREEGLKLLKKYVRNENMIKHSLASEAVMRSIAVRIGEDQDKYGLAGLLHDIDVEITNADPKVHGLKSVEILENSDIDPEIIDAVKHHNEKATGKERTGIFQHSLAAGETITGLITATALVYPDKRLSSVKPKSVRKRMKEKKFAASVKRSNILECEKAGIPLDEFIVISLDAMKKISNELGL
jgi:putative nucleotidyltransferase with HDIG domain